MTLPTGRTVPGTKPSETPTFGSWIWEEKGVTGRGREGEKGGERRTLPLYEPPSVTPRVVISHLYLTAVPVSGPWGFRFQETEI